MKAKEGVVDRLNNILTIELNRHQPVFHPCRDVQELGVRTHLQPFS